MFLHASAVQCSGSRAYSGVTATITFGIFGNLMIEHLVLALNHQQIVCNRMTMDW
jgi:hypothetical protein